MMSATEEVVGVHVDGHKVVSCSAHGLVCAWDCRMWQLLVCGFMGVPGVQNRWQRSPVSTVSVDGTWVVAGTQAADAADGSLLHVLSVAGELC